MQMIVDTIDTGGLPEGLYAAGLGEVAKGHAGVSIGSYPSFDANGFRNQIVVRGKDPAAVAAAAASVRDLIARLQSDRAPL